MNFPVTEKKRKLLLEEMQRLEIQEKDIEETFLPSQGAGGQNVNKVATCVFLKYPPLELSVKCQKARTQGLNRYYARKLLVEKVSLVKEGKLSGAQKKIEKLRKQKKKRRRKAKEKIRSANKEEINKEDSK